MAGKSTFLRQNALIALLAQIGSFVPATRARIGIIDRLFSRVGAAERGGAADGRGEGVASRRDVAARGARRPSCRSSASEPSNDQRMML
jgi:hypothetical protein